MYVTLFWVFIQDKVITFLTINYNEIIGKPYFFLGEGSRLIFSLRQWTTMDFIK